VHKTAGGCVLTLLCPCALLLTDYVLIVALLALFPSKLSFEFVDSHVDTLVSVFAGFGNNEDLAVFASCDYLHADVAAWLTADDYLDLIDTIVVPGKLGGLLLGVAFDSFRYVDVFTGNCKKQNRSP